MSAREAVDLAFYGTLLALLVLFAVIGLVGVRP